MSYHEVTEQLAVYAARIMELERNASEMRNTLDALLEVAEQVVDTRRCSVGILRAMNHARKFVTPNVGAKA